MYKKQINSLFQLFFFSLFLLSHLSWSQDSLAVDSLDQVLADTAVIPDTHAGDSTEVSVLDSTTSVPVTDSSLTVQPTESSTDTPSSSVSEKIVIRKIMLDNTPVSKSKKQGRGALSWIFSHLIHLMVLVVSVVMIVFTIIFYLSKKDSRRFLTTTRLSVFDKMVQRTCRHIESNFMDPDMTVKSICNDLVAGESFLQALFEKELGISIDSFIDQVRINNVRLLLEENPHLEADQLFLQSGFSDMPLALETFRRITGVSFEVFRERLQEKTPAS